MNESSQPSDAKLSSLLREARTSPGLPPRFEQNVWRRIEAAEARPECGSWLDALASVILRPKFGMAFAAAILLAGVFAGTMEGRQVARHDAQMNYLSSVAPAAVR